jgi:predicted DNA binding CopG/RHH family protein
MKKESKISKIAGGFNDDLDIDKLASVASQMSTPSVSTTVTTVTTVVAVETGKKDRRFTIILPHELYMRMVLKTKSDGISFTRYIHQLMESDLPK